jgi:hypothetical protein
MKRRGALVTAERNKTTATGQREFNLIYNALHLRMPSFMHWLTNNIITIPKTGSSRKSYSPVSHKKGTPKSVLADGKL